MMVVGSTLKDVETVTPPPPGALKEDKSAAGLSLASAYTCTVFVNCD